MRALAVVAVALTVAGVATAASRRVERVAKGPVQAELSYVVVQPHVFSDVRIRVRRAGRTYVDERPKLGCRAACLAGPAWFPPRTNAVHLVDLAHDGEREVLVDLYTGGAHCCEYTLFYRYTGGRYVRTRHGWKNVSYRLADIDHDRVFELVSRDDFSYVFSCYACSGSPIQIWHFAGGRLVDVTRSFPRLVGADAQGWWRRYLRERYRFADARGVLAAYMADKYLLGEQREGWQRLRRVNARGDLSPPHYCSRAQPCGARYLSALRRFLKQRGYAA